MSVKIAGPWVKGANWHKYETWHRLLLENSKLDNIWVYGELGKMEYDMVLSKLGFISVSQEQLNKYLILL